MKTKLGALKTSSTAKITLSYDGNEKAKQLFVNSVNSLADINIERSIGNKQTLKISAGNVVSKDDFLRWFAELEDGGILDRKYIKITPEDHNNNNINIDNFNAACYQAETEDDTDLSVGSTVMQEASEVPTNKNFQQRITPVKAPQLSPEEIQALLAPKPINSIPKNNDSQSKSADIIKILTSQDEETIRPILLKQYGDHFYINPRTKKFSIRQIGKRDITAKNKERANEALLKEQSRPEFSVLNPQEEDLELYKSKSDLIWLLLKSRIGGDKFTNTDRIENYRLIATKLLNDPVITLEKKDLEECISLLKKLALNVAKNNPKLTEQCNTGFKPLLIEKIKNPIDAVKPVSQHITQENIAQPEKPPVETTVVSTPSTSSIPPTDPTALTVEGNHHEETPHDPIDNSEKAREALLEQQKQMSRLVTEREHLTKMDKEQSLRINKTQNDLNQLKSKREGLEKEIEALNNTIAETAKMDAQSGNSANLDSTTATSAETATTDDPSNDLANQLTEKQKQLTEKKKQLTALQESQQDNDLKLQKATSNLEDKKIKRGEALNFSGIYKFFIKIFYTNFYNQETMRTMTLDLEIKELNKEITTYEATQATIKKTISLIEDSISSIENTISSIKTTKDITEKTKDINTRMIDSDRRLPHDLLALQKIIKQQDMEQVTSEITLYEKRLQKGQDERLKTQTEITEKTDDINRLKQSIGGPNHTHPTHQQHLAQSIKHQLDKMKKTEEANGSALTSDIKPPSQ